MLQFDQEWLLSRLRRLSASERLTFALTCAERLFALYAVYAADTGLGRPDHLRSTLDSLVEVIASGKHGTALTFLEDYEALIPGDNAEWTPLNPLAENAVAAIAYACYCARNADPQDAAWAALQGYEAVDYLACTLSGVDFSRREAESAILGTEYVQAELLRQSRDLAEIEGNTGDDAASVGLALVSRARIESQTLVLIARKLIVTEGD